MSRCGEPDAGAVQPPAYGSPEGCADFAAGLVHLSLDQKATAKSPIKLHLTNDTAPQFAAATGVDAGVLARVAGKMTSGEKLDDQEMNVLGRFDLALTAILDGLKQAALRFPNPAMPINTLPLIEARARSESENIVSTADRLFRHLRADGGADAATREALRCRRALLEGVKILKNRPLTTRVAESICTQIKGVRMTVHSA